MLELRTKKKLKRKTVFILKGSLLVFLILSFFSSYLKPVQGKNTFTGFFQNFIYPFQITFSQTKLFIKSSLDRYIYLVSVAEKNEELEKENFKLKAHLLEYKEFQNEIVRLRELLNFSSKFSKTSVEVAQVVGVFNRLTSQGIRISSGSLGGVLVGMPIVSPEGVVGKVIRTSYAFSDVLLVTDANFVLDILLERTRARGLLRGSSSDICLLEVHKATDLKIGDTLITSGLLENFPKGIPVGVVSKIEVDTEKTVKIAEIKLWSELKSLEEVLILKKVLPFEKKIKKITKSLENPVIKR